MKNRLVDTLVCLEYILYIKTIEVGAFEAKTHFSELLREVEEQIELAARHHIRLKTFDSHLLNLKDIFSFIR